MPETRLELGVPPAQAKAPRTHTYVPLQWFRRRRTLVACITLIACALLYLHAAAPASRWHPYRRPAGDADIDALLRTVPGAVPGRDVVVTDVLADAGHAGKPYPTREHLTLLLLGQLQDPAFSFAASPWPQWAPWVADETQRPRNAHVQFLTELKRAGNGTDDVRLVRGLPHSRSSSSTPRTGRSSTASARRSPCSRSRTAPTRAAPRRCSTRTTRTTTSTRSTCTVRRRTSHSRDRLLCAAALGPHGAPHVPQGARGRAPPRTSLCTHPGRQRCTRRARP